MTQERILITDDDPQVRSSLAFVLEEGGYHVTAVEDGKGALDKLKQEPFDIILLDYKLPDTDGLEVAKIITETHPNVSIIFMTGYSSLETALTIMKLGAFDFLQKPIYQDTLMSAIKRCVLTKTFLAEGLESLHTPKVLVVDDEHSICSALEELFRGEGYYCKSCSSGSEALKMVQEELFHLMIVDLKLEDMEGTEVVTAVRKYFPEMLAIIITGNPSIDSAVKAIKSSAYDYIVKPLNGDDILYRVKIGWERHRQSILVKQLLQNLRVTNLELEKANSKLKVLSVTDNLTLLFNHRHLVDALSLEYKKAARHGLLLSLMLIDLDYFKFINDTYGHPTGDKVLVEVAAVLKGQTRETDILGRYGGEEFCIILPNTDANGALTVAEKMRRAVAERKFAVGEDAFCNITVSIGVGAFTPETVGSVEDLFRQADDALYEAKYKGRNRTVRWTEIQKESEGLIPIANATINSAQEYIQKASYTSKILRDNCIQSVNAMVLALEAKDGYTATHCHLVSQYAVMLAKEAGLPVEEIEATRIAALLHDIGKINIPERILLKEKKLTEEERDIIKKHPDVGARILAPLSFLNKEAEIIRSHQERWDGTGYPRGLKEYEIPVGARILTVCDVFEAVTAVRPYRKKPLTVNEAVEVLEKGAGTSFEPRLVELFVPKVKEMLRSKRELYIKEMNKAVPLPAA